ncbi:ATP synthase F1 subunit epsilon [uncultured Clostridium sp.]|uniref:ATP synthase F1 subunit epsilon n=1 Tax=uncultured Clostridium sp. TaxID=59620 RepID=UPI0025E58CE6|nr:ATP synthase F1 subunit epsilon [uncultured Clostridium sp.]
MANNFLLKIVTPSHDVYEGLVQRVFLKNSDGEFEVLANHESMITSTVPNITKFVDDKGQEYELFISTAIVNVIKGEVIICSDAAEFAEDIDFSRAEEAKKRAEEKMLSPGIFDKERVKLALLRATERLKLKNK